MLPQVDFEAASVAQVNAQAGGLWAATREATRLTPASMLKTATML